ncbi:MAG: hypothetical protein JXR75_01545 [Rhodobacteraceae bacterium]|nr:hypothetical protein [Paracoccaceae bacterium]
MTEANRLQRLKHIADLLRERDLSRLSAAGSARSKTEDLLAALDQTRSTGDLSPAIAGQVSDRFGNWTANRRGQLNQQLARETVVWMAAQSAARSSFGRSEVLGKIINKR